MNQMTWRLSLVLIMWAVVVSSRLEMSWVDTPDDDVVQKINPGQDLEHHRLAVGFVNQELSFTCKAEKAAAIDELEFVTNGDFIKPEEQKVNQIFDKFNIERTGRINPVEEHMDNSLIKCAYDKVGGAADSVNITLSVWKLTITAEPNVCDDKKGDITINMAEVKQWSVGETNLLDRVKEKMVKELGINQEKIQPVAGENKFTATLTFGGVKQIRIQLKKMTDNIEVGDKSISVTDCFAESSPQQEEQSGATTLPSEKAGGDSGAPIGGIVGGCIAAIAAVGGVVVGGLYYKKKKSQPSYSQVDINLGEQKNPKNDV